MPVSELCFMQATELARRIRHKEISCMEVMQAHLAQIERVNPTLNAIVTLLPDAAIARARAADEAIARGERLGVLHGLPIAHKDLVPTKGIRTTYGSPIYADHVPDEICTTNQVPPFDVSIPYLTEINGVKMETYIDWMRSNWTITITGHPAISVPCGFTEAGLPVGMQIVGRHQDDFGVLQLAHAFEQATEVWKQRPALAA